MMHVQQPQQEGDGEAAHHDDCSNYRARTNSSLFHAAN
jgi:hypothetical protein